jgi:hypothetical protein
VQQCGTAHAAAHEREEGHLADRRADQAGSARLRRKPPPGMCISLSLRLLDSARSTLTRGCRKTKRRLRCSWE